MMKKKIGNFNDIEEIKELRNKFQNITDDLNKVIDLCQSEKNDDEVEKDLEIALALFLMHCVELQNNM